MYVPLCVFMYINMNSLFICRGKNNSPLFVGWQGAGQTPAGCPREVMEPSALETFNAGLS